MLAEGARYTFSFNQILLGEFLYGVLLWWLIGLILIAGGAFGLQRYKKGRFELLALAASMLGFSVCILLGWYFTPFSRQPLYMWTDDKNINYWTDICVALMISGTSLLFFVVGGKIGKLSVKRTEANAN